MHYSQIHLLNLYLLHQRKPCTKYQVWNLPCGAGLLSRKFQKFIYFWFFALISYVYMINLNLYSCRLCAKFDWNVSMSKWFHHLGMHLQYLRMYVQYLVIYIQISCDVYFITFWCKCNHCILGDMIQSLLSTQWHHITENAIILLYMHHMIWNIRNKILGTHYKLLHKYHKI